MLVRFLQTVYLDGKKFERDSEPFHWPADREAAAMDLCERGYLELLAEPVEEEKPKGKRGG